MERMEDRSAAACPRQIFLLPGPLESADNREFIPVDSPGSTRPIDAISQQEERGDSKDQQGYAQWKQNFNKAS